MKILKEFSILYLVCFFATIFLYYILLKISKSQGNIFKKYLYTASGKSVSNAILLGGLPLAISIITSTLFIILYSYSGLLIFQKNIMLSMSGCSLFIVIYGYLDDKYELRPAVKLIMQFLAVTSFSLLTSKYLSTEYSNIAFFIQFIIGMALVNGTNLLDGLDTLTIKLSAASFAGFSILGALNFIQIIPILSIAYTVPLLAFYVYNRSPAKIHLGEIGSSFIGFVYFSLSTLFFSCLSIKSSLSMSEIFCISTLPTILPITELAVSFFRRLYNKRSPFSGDRFHIHQILRNIHNIEPSNVANIMSVIYFLCMFFCIVLSSYYKLHSGFAFGLLQITVLTFYLTIGLRHWQGPNAIHFNAKTIFDSLRKKDVTFVETSQINNFEFHLMKKGEVEEEEGGDSEAS